MGLPAPGVLADIASIIIALLALVVAMKSAASSARSATASEKSATSATQSAHDQFRPSLPETIPAFPKLPTRDKPDIDVFGDIRVERTYRVEATRLVGNSTEQMNLPEVLPAGATQEFFIETIPPGGEAPRTEQVRFRFWPPAEEDGADWECPCDAPRDRGRGHWEVMVSVSYTPPPKPFAMYG